MRAPGPGSRCMLRLLDRKRIPPVLRFWVMVANLPPPVPRKTSSTSPMIFTGKVEVHLFVFLQKYGGESLLRHLNFGDIERIIYCNLS